ncbi:MAG: hypothetical protein AAGG38_00060 [Planctomycetota bacterium]
MAASDTHRPFFDFTGKPGADAAARVGRLGSARRTGAEAATGQPVGPIPGVRRAAPDPPPLRLVGASAAVQPDLAAARDRDNHAIAGTTDSRWVLAVRVAEELEGAILPPDKRDRLVKLGKMFGLTAFDANLIIAIVQDQARRGFSPSHCPAAGEGLLRMVPPARRERWMTGRRTLLIAALIAGFIALELVVLSLVF